MSGFTTTSTISELIGKRPINQKRRSKRRNKRSYKARQQVLRLKKV